MSAGSANYSQEDERIKQAIAQLIAAVRGNRSGIDEANALMALIAQLRDVNQNLVLAAIKAQVAQEEAETRSRQQNEFLAMLAHELRNPIAPISNAAMLLEKIASAHPLLPEIQGIISRQVEHMSHLIDDLLDAARITSGKIILKKSRITINDVIGRSVEMAKAGIEQRYQSLDVEPLPRVIPLDGDIVRLSQALSNLLVNASKFTPPNGNIRLSVRQEGGKARISVSDNGIGIDPALLPHIFELFRQGPRTLARSEGGLGIGLSVAKGLVEMHGGTISAHSDGLNTGSEFEMVLPIATGMEHAPSSGKPADMAPSERRRILLVEDNPDTVATLRLLLELGGHEITSALDGLTGLSLATAHTFDVIVCDIGLPDLNGYDLIAQLRQQTHRRQPFAIALSGYGQPEDRERAEKAGFDAYLVKPIKGDSLQELIASRTEVS